MMYLAIAVVLILFFISKKAYKLFFIPWFSVPRNEFAQSLEIDSPFVASAPPWVRTLYMRNLVWRRARAHARDLTKS